MRLHRLTAALGLAAVLVSTTANAGNASTEKDQKAGAQKTFDAAGKLFDGHHYSEALVAFRASNQISPSPNSHLMIARCLRELAQNVEAYREYDAVVREATEKGDRYESARQAATDEREEVKQRIAFLTVRVADAPEGLKVRLGDQPLDVAALGTPLPLMPGPAVVTADAPNGASARSQVELAAGASQEMNLVLVAPAADAPPPPPPPPPVVKVAVPPPSGIPLRTWAYVAGGVGVAGMATFAIFGSMSSSKYSSLKEDCPNGACPTDRQDDIDSGKSSQTIANVGLGVGIVGLATGTVLFLLGGNEKREGTATSGVRVNVGAGSVAVKGTF